MNSYTFKVLAYKRITDNIMKWYLCTFSVYFDWVPPLNSTSYISTTLKICSMVNSSVIIALSWYKLIHINNLM